MSRQKPRRFALLKKLGEGSIGIVYEAYDRKRQMRVALKTLRHLDPQALFRLKQEFRAVRSLSHPNIVTLYELVEEDNAWFITMELVDGADFVAYARTDDLTGDDIDVTGERAEDRGDDELSGPVSAAVDMAPPVAAFSAVVDESRLRRALAQLAQGLHAIHLAGLIHRDLKPSNVRVTELGRVVLMDFSIVAEARNAKDLSSSGAIVIGTPWYMAPEQATGDPPSAAIDWYALGVLMYQAITGRVPFAGSWDEVLLDKQQYDARPPSALVSGVPHDLDELCLELLARRPADRPTGEEVLHLLGVAADNVANVLQGIGDGSFVGRERELGALAAGLAEGQPGVLVSGPSGIGKSMLLTRFTTRASEYRGEPVIVLNGVCYPTDTVPYKAVDGVVDELSRALLELPKERSDAILPEDVAALLPMFPVLGRVPDIQLAPPVKSTTRREMRQKAVRALRQLLGNLAAWRSVILAIDDLQWADRDSLELIDELGDPSWPARVLLIGTVRSDSGERYSLDSDTSGEVAALVGRRSFGVLELPALEADEQNQLLAQLVGGRTASLRDFIPGGADCTPLFVSELVRHVVELPDALDDDRVPQLPYILRERIGRLPERARVLLEIIAIAGEPAPLSILAEAAHLGEGQRERSSATLRAARLIRIERPGREPWLTPFHERVRETVLAGLTTERRHELHQRLAEAFHRSGVATADLLAYHWHLAEDFERAREYLVKAARSGFERLAFERAAEMYRAACFASASHASARGGLLPALAESLVLAGRYQEAAQVYDQIARDAGDGSGRLRCLAADSLLRAGQVDAAARQIREVVRDLEVPIAPSRKKSKLVSLSPRVRLTLRGWRDRARDEGEIAVRDLERLDTLYAASTRFAVIDYASGAWLQAEHLGRSLRHAERSRMCRALASELPYLAAVGGRQLERAEALGRDVLSEAETLGRPATLGLVRLALAAVAYLAGRYGEAGDHALRSRELMGEGGDENYWECVAARYLYAMSLVQSGNLAAAADDVAEALADARRAGDAFMTAAFGCRPNTWRLLCADRPDDALAVVDAIAARWGGQDAPIIHHAIAVARVMGHIYRCDSDRAAAAVAECEQTAQSMPVAQIPWLEAELHVLAGRVALLRGDLEEAGKVARNIARMRWPVVLGHADCIHAAMTHCEGFDGRAEKFLNDAIIRFEEIGAEHYGMSAKFRLGQIIGSERGHSLVAEATYWCENQGVVDAGQMFDYLFPWPGTNG